MPFDVPPYNLDGTMPDPDPADTVAECAKHLVLIASELRSMGDVNLVLLSEDGVTPCPATLADELWSIAVRLGAHNDGTDLPGSADPAAGTMGP